MSALETFYPAAFTDLATEVYLYLVHNAANKAEWYQIKVMPISVGVFNISAAALTYIIISSYVILFIYAYKEIMTTQTLTNKRASVFLMFIRWCFNYLTNNPYKTFWGFLFRTMFLSLAFTIFLSNFLGLISISFILTSYLSITLALSLVTFTSFNVTSMLLFNTNWLRIFLPYNIPLAMTYPVVALEFVSYSLRVISLSVRLFANITSGHLLMNVLSGILWSLATGLFTVILFFIWGPFAAILLLVSAIEVFISFLQGFVYLILLKIYSDDSLNVLTSSTNVSKDVILNNAFIEGVASKTMHKMYLMATAKKKKETEKDTKKETEKSNKKESEKAAKKTEKPATKKSTKKSNKTSEFDNLGEGVIVPEALIQALEADDEDLDFNPMPLEDLKSGKYHIKFDYTKPIIGFNTARQTKPREDYGIISRVDGGIIYITGLYKLSVGEIVYFGRNMEQAITLNLERNIAKAAIFGTNESVTQGTPVFRSFRLMKVSIGPQLLGKVIDCLGNCLSEDTAFGANDTLISRTVDVKALGVIDRKSINEPLITGVLSIDSMLPIGRGQRELIIGDRQLGKTSLAIDSIISQKNLHISEYRVLSPVYCVYVAVGQKLSSLARLATQLKRKNALHYTIIVSAAAAESAAMQYLVPYVGCAIAEWFLSRNGHALIVYDDLGIQATAYRQLSLLLRRPPGREAYPGDIFYLHSRLLERAAKVNEKNGLGSITALPIVETKDGDLSAYIPTNVISITDGQVFLSAAIFYKDIKPAVHFTKSVSRVGSKAQTKGIKRLVGLLKRLLALYEDLKYYETLDTGELNEAIKSVLNAGYHLMTIFKQKRFRPYMLQEQFVLIWAAIMSFNHVSRESSNDFKAFLVRSIAFDDWAIVKLLNVGFNTTTDLTNIFVLLNIYYWERCVVYNSISN